MPESQSETVALAVRAATEWMEVSPGATPLFRIRKYNSAGGDGTSLSPRPHLSCDS